MARKFLVNGSKRHPKPEVDLGPLTRTFLVNGSTKAPRPEFVLGAIDKYLTRKLPYPAGLNVLPGPSVSILLKWAKKPPFQFVFGPLARKVLVKHHREQISCCKGFRRAPNAWKMLLSLRRCSWQSSGPSFRAHFDTAETPDPPPRNVLLHTSLSILVKSKKSSFDNDI